MRDLTKKLRVVLMVMLAVVCLSALSGCAGALQRQSASTTTTDTSADSTQSTQTTAERDAAINQRKVRAYFDKAKADPIQLTALIQGMPKGADLHRQATDLNDIDNLKAMIADAQYEHVSYLEVVGLPDAKQAEAIEKLVSDTKNSSEVNIRFIAPVSRDLNTEDFKAALTQALDAQYVEGQNVVGCLILAPEEFYGADTTKAQLEIIDQVYQQYAGQEGRTPPVIDFIVGRFGFYVDTPSANPNHLSLDKQLTLSHARRIEPDDSLVWQTGLYDGLNVLKTAKYGAVLRFDNIDLFDGSKDLAVQFGDSVPYELFKSVGVPVALASGNPPLGSRDGRYTKLYTAATIAYDLTYDDYKTLVYASFEVSSLPDWGKAWFKSDLDGKFAAYEQWAAWQFDQLGL